MAYRRRTMEFVDSRDSDCDSNWQTISQEMVAWERAGMLPKRPSPKRDRETVPVKLIYSCPHVCVMHFVGMASARAAQSSLGGTLRAFIDGKWQDVKE